MNVIGAEYLMGMEKYLFIMDEGVCKQHNMQCTHLLAHFARHFFMSHNTDANDDVSQRIMLFIC
jgi:hypothetical protein